MEKLRAFALKQELRRSSRPLIYVTSAAEFYFLQDVVYSRMTAMYGMPFISVAWNDMLIDISNKLKEFEITKFIYETTGSSTCKAKRDMLKGFQAEGWEIVEKIKHGHRNLVLLKLIDDKKE